MDLRNPLEAVIPGAQGKVLQALLAAGRPLSTSDAARVACVSQPQASRVLARLVGLGLVVRTDVPPAVLHHPAEGNAVIRALESIRTLRDRSIEEMRRSVARLRPGPAAAVLFGSVARDGGDEHSDVDVVLVRPEAVSADIWSDVCAEWAAGIERLCGSPVNVLEISTPDWESRSFDQGLWQTIRDDGIDLLAPGRSSPLRRGRV